MESSELAPPPEGASVEAQISWLRTRVVNVEKRQLLVDERVGQLRKEIQDLGQRDEQVVAEVSETRRALGQELQTIAAKLDSLRIWQAELKGYGAMLVMATAAVMAVVQLERSGGCAGRPSDITQYMFIETRMIERQLKTNCRFDRENEAYTLWITR